MFFVFILPFRGRSVNTKRAEKGANSAYFFTKFENNVHLLPDFNFFADKISAAECKKRFNAVS